MTIKKENFTSENLFEKINILTEGEKNKILHGLHWTSENVLEAVLIGGISTVHYINGDRYLTPDVDFIIEDIDKFKSKLENDGYQYKSLNSGQEYDLGITIDEFNTDYLDSTKGNILLNKVILSTPNTTLIGGYEFKIINPELLAIMKLDLGRDKDIEDGLLLLNSGKLNKTKFTHYLNLLKNSLYDYDSIYSYRSMIN